MTFGRSATGFVYHRMRMLLSRTGEPWRASAFCGADLVRLTGDDGKFCGRCAQVLAFHTARGAVWAVKKEEQV